MEMLVLYDKDRNQVDKTISRGSVVPEGLFRLVVHVCVFNTQGKLLIQKRKMDKEDWPGMWDVSVGGSAIAGESSRQAARRETMEEIGIDMDFDNIRPKLTVSFKEGFDDWYMVTYDAPLESFTPQKEELDDLKWVSENELLELIRKKVFVPFYFAEKLFDIYKLPGALY